MTLLIDPTQDRESLIAEGAIRSITGDMTFFPLCCSTGVPKCIGATRVTTYCKSLPAPNDFTAHFISELDSAQYIYQLRRAGPSSVIVPYEFAIWDTMSMIAAKCVEGHDDGPSGGYNGFKASSIAMFDRLNADKDNPEFKYSYNQVYSVDHFIEWLEAQGGKYGEVLVSSAEPGGHGARVRGCIFTPDKDAVQQFNDDRIESVRQHYRTIRDMATKAALKEAPADAVGDLW